MDGFDVVSRPHGEWEVVHVKGDVDVYSAPTLQSLLLKKVEQGQNRIVVDLRNVQFLDSSGLSVMIGGARRARESRGELVIASPSEQVERVLRITDLARVLPIYPTVDEAVTRAGRPDARNGD